MVLHQIPVSTVAKSSGSLVINSNNDELFGVHFGGIGETMTGYAVHFQIVCDILREQIPVLSQVQNLN